MALHAIWRGKDGVEPFLLCNPVISSSVAWRLYRAPNPSVGVMLSMRERSEVSTNQKPRRFNRRVTHAATTYCSRNSSPQTVFRVNERIQNE